MADFKTIPVSLSVRHTKINESDFVDGYPSTMTSADAAIVYKNNDVAIVIFDHCGDRFSFGGSIGTGGDTNGTFDLENLDYCVFIDVQSEELNDYNLTSVSHSKRSTMLYYHHNEFWDRCE